MAVKRYDGSAWQTVAGLGAQGAAGADGTAPLTTKGDILTYGTAATRLAVGNNGETLVADSSATTGLRWQGNYAAGKNKIINGDMAINQRNFTTFTTSTGGGSAYGFDRWLGYNYFSNGTLTYSAQTFTPGSAPVAGYEAANFARLVTSGMTNANDGAIIYQSVEDVRTFAGQTATISFWAKAASGTPKVAVEVQQGFGSGGSPSAAVNTYAGQVTLSTSWARYSLTVTVPSISGKTIGTTANTSYVGLNIFVSAGSTYNARTGSLGNQNNTFDFWGFQFEAGSVATAFQTATGTLAGELAACQRYYYRQSGGDSYGCFATGAARSTTVVYAFMPLPVTMRVAPTSMDLSTISVEDYSGTTWNSGTFTLESGGQQKNTAWIRYTHGSAVFTQYRPAFLSVVGSSSAYIGFSAEL